MISVSAHNPFGKMYFLAQIGSGVIHPRVIHPNSGFHFNRDYWNNYHESFGLSKKKSQNHNTIKNSSDFMEITNISSKTKNNFPR